MSPCPPGVYLRIMAVPDVVLSFAEAHPCLSGCFEGRGSAQACFDPTQPMVPLFEATCEDCSTFRLSVLEALLPSGADATSFAAELTQHVRTERGYLWSLGGYQYLGSGNGFWLNAAYLGRGLFLVDGSSNSSTQGDVEFLVRAFKNNLATPEDPGMLRVGAFQSKVVYLDLRRARQLDQVQGSQDLLQTVPWSARAKSGFVRVAILEYQGARSAQATAQAQAALQFNQPSTPTTSCTPTELTQPKAPAEPGSICPICGARVEERQLFSSTFVGCLC